MTPSKSSRLTATNTLPRYNERRVLQVIRRMGEASKADLARQTNLTNTAVGTIVSNLHRKHLLSVSQKRLSGQRGQPATLYRLEATGSFSIGVRVDRNWIQAILIDFNGNVVSRLSHELILPKPEMALEIILKDVNSLLEMMPEHQRDRLAGIGCAYPYNLESWLNELSLPHDEFRRWKDFDLAGHIADSISIPVCSENDASAASIAELFYGLGRDMDDFLYIFFGPAVGGGIVINGESVRGSKGNAGDLGLMPVLPSKLSSAPRPTGKWDILLNRASVNTLIRHLRACGHDIYSFSDVNFLVERQAKAVIEWMDDCVAPLAPVLWSGVALLNTPAVVVASDLGDEFIRQLMTKLKKKLESSAPEARTPPKLLPGSFGNDAEVIGAANLPFFYQFSTQHHTIEQTGSNGVKQVKEN